MRLVLALIVLGLVFAAPAGATVIRVDTFNDPGGPGRCSLREAVQAANTNAIFNDCHGGPAGETDTILLRAGPHVLSEPGAGETANNTGDLDVLATGGPLVIAGAGSGSTSISAAGITGGDRIMDVVA